MEQKQEQQQGSEIEQKEDNSKVLKIKALLFASARELAGVSETTLELDSGCSTTTSDCVQKLIAEFPALQKLSACMVVALNHAYVNGSVVVKDGDELALIPPISGG